MQNIAILLYDYSLLGGVQRVTCNLAKLMHENGFPIKCVMSIRKDGTVEYDYPIPIEVVGDDKSMYYRINDCVKKYNVNQVVVQIENLKFLYPIIIHFDKNNLRVLPVLHSSPYNWVKKYYSFSEYIGSLRYIYQWVKMQVYWKRLHLTMFRDIVSKHAVICVSAQARKEMCELLCLPQNTEMIKYIYNPVLLSVNNSGTKDNLVVYAGRLEPDKRPMLMLEMWKRLEKKYPEWRFTILGGGPLYDKMKSFILEEKLNHVNLEGVVNNVSSYLQRSKISVLLSKYEGLPTVMLEACYNNNALVASYNDGGTRDVVIDGINGYLVDPSNLEQIVEVMSSLMENNGEKALKAGSRNDDVRKKFERTEIVNAWKKVLS